MLNTRNTRTQATVETLERHASIQLYNVIFPDGTSGLIPKRTLSNLQLPCHIVPKFIVIRNLYHPVHSKEDQDLLVKINSLQWVTPAHLSIPQIPSDDYVWADAKKVFFVVAMVFGTLCNSL